MDECVPHSRGALIFLDSPTMYEPSTPPVRDFTLSPLPDESKLVSVPVLRLLTTPRGV